MTRSDPVERLVDALTEAGHPPPPPADDTALRELEREIEPLELPATLRRLWERIDAHTWRVRVWPFLSTPDFALSGWQLNRDSQIFAPGLLPFCYESHFHLLVELEGAGVPGGTVFAAGFDDDAARLRCVQIADWVDAVAAVIADGAFEVKTYEQTGDQIRIDLDRFDAVLADRLTAALPHPVYGDTQAIPFDPERWPHHWHAAAEPTRREQAPKGATATVAEVLTRARSEEVRETLAGVGVMQSFGNGVMRLLLTDRTALIDIACPPGIPGGGGASGEPFVEVDVRVARMAGPRPPVDWRSLAGDEPFALHRLHAQIEPQAVAEAIRSLPADPQDPANRLRP